MKEDEVVGVVVLVVDVVLLPRSLKIGYLLVFYKNVLGLIMIHHY